MEKFKATADGLVKYVKECKLSPHVYLWDGNGEYLTNDILELLIAKHKDWYTEERIAVRRSLCDRGIRGWDCIGLIKSYIWHDYHQNNSQYYSIDSDLSTRTLMEGELEKGDIDELPERPGLVLWKKGHVGVYIGNGKVIECTIYNPSSKKAELIGGIIESSLEDSDWTVWLKYPGIIY